MAGGRELTMADDAFDPQDDPFLSFARSTEPKREDEDPFLAFAKATEPKVHPALERSAGDAPRIPSAQETAPSPIIEGIKGQLGRIKRAWQAKPEEPAVLPGRERMPSEIRIEEKRSGWISPAKAREIEQVVPRAAPRLDEVVASSPVFTEGKKAAQYSKQRAANAEEKVRATLEEAKASGDGDRYNRAADVLNDIAKIKAVRAQSFASDVAGRGAQGYGFSEDVRQAREVLPSQIEAKLAELGIKNDDGTPVSFTTDEWLKELLGGIVGFEMAALPVKAVLGAASKFIPGVSDLIKGQQAAATFAPAAPKLGVRGTTQLARPGLTAELAADKFAANAIADATFGQGRMAVQTGADAASRDEPILPAIAGGVLPGLAMGAGLGEAGRAVAGAVGAGLRGAQEAGRKLGQRWDAHLNRIGAEAEVAKDLDPAFRSREHLESLRDAVNRELAGPRPPEAPSPTTPVLGERPRPEAPEGLGSKVGKVGAAATLAAIAARKLGKQTEEDEFDKFAAQSEEGGGMENAMGGLLLAGTMLGNRRAQFHDAFRESGYGDPFSAFGTPQAKKFMREAESIAPRYLSEVVRPALGADAVTTEKGIPRLWLHGTPKDYPGLPSIKHAVFRGNPVDDGTFYTDTPSEAWHYADPTIPSVAVARLANLKEVRPEIKAAFARGKKVLDYQGEYRLAELKTEEPELFRALQDAAEKERDASVASPLVDEDMVDTVLKDYPAYDDVVTGEQIHSLLTSDYSRLRDQSGYVDPAAWESVAGKGARPNDPLRKLGIDAITSFDHGGGGGRVYIALNDDAMMGVDAVVNNLSQSRYPEAKRLIEFIKARPTSDIAKGVSAIALATAATASPSEAQAQEVDDDLAFAQGKTAPVEKEPRDPAEKFAIGAGTIAAATLLVSGARRGYGTILREIAAGKPGEGISPVALAALGYALAEVPDQDYQDFGKGVMGLAALKAIGTNRMLAAKGKVGETIINAAKDWGAEGVIRAFSPDYLLSPEILEALQTFRGMVAKGRAQSLEVAKKTGDLTPSANRLVTDILRGENWEQNFSPEDAKSAFAMAADVQQTMAEMGKAKLAEGIITPAQFAASGGENYLPRLFAYHEARRLNPAGLKANYGAGGDAIRIGQQKSRILDAPVREAQADLDIAKRMLADADRADDDALRATAQEKVAAAETKLQEATDTREARRHELGEIREAGYLASYGLEKGWSSIGAAVLMKTMRDVPGAIHPEWTAAFDEFAKAKQELDTALDKPQRDAMRELLQTAELRVDAARRKVTSLSERRYLGYPEGSQRFVKEQEMATAEFVAANEERKQLQQMIRDAGSKPDRAAAKAHMEAAKARMQEISDQFQRERGLFGGPGEYVTLPQSKGLGALAGAVVKKEVAMAIEGLPTLPVIHKMMRTWKQIKTVFNPGTHVGNVMSNAVMWHMAGVPMTRQAPWLIKATKNLMAYGPETKALAEEGILGVNSLNEPAEGALRGTFGPKPEELLALRKTTRPETAKVLEEQGVQSLGERLQARGHTRTAALADKLTELEGPDRRMGSRWQYEGIGARKFAKGMKRLYENEDNVFRIAAYLQARAPIAQGGRGLSHEMAARIAREDLINFHSNSPLLAITRSTVAPFVLYPVKAIPTFARHIIDNPERWIVASASLMALNELAQQQVGYELADADIPKRERKSGFGALIPDVIQMPFGRSDRGGIPAMDFTRWTPGSALVTGAPPGTTAGRLGMPGIVAGSGPWSDVFNLLNNKDAWTDRPLLTAEDDINNPRSWGKVGERLADIALPAIAGFQRRRLNEDIKRDDPQAQMQDVLGAMGLRPRYYQPGEGRRREIIDVKNTIKDIREGTKSNLRKSQNSEYSQEQREEARSRRQRAMEKLLESRRTQRP